MKNSADSKTARRWRPELPAGRQATETGRMFTPLKAVVALTWPIHADRAGVWGSPLRPNLTPLAQYPASTRSPSATDSERSQ